MTPLEKLPRAFVLTHESDPRRQRKGVSLIALALTRALGRRGVPVVRVHPNRLDHSLSSRYVSAVEVSPDLYASEEALRDFLLALAERYPGRRVLFPGSDDCAAFIASHHAALSTAYIVCGPDAAIMARIGNKQAQYEAAQALGIPVPETYFPADPAEVARLAPTLRHFPYVIKPLVAHHWRRAALASVSHGRKGFAVHDAAELVERYGQIAAGDPAVMIQEVIGGADDRLFTFMSYCDAQSRPLAYCTRQKIRQYPVDFGYCTLTVSCHDEAVREQSLRLLQGIGFHGISGIEWKRHPVSGEVQLIEINPRAVNTTALAAACGSDIVYVAFCDALGLHPAPQTHWRSGIKWINFDQDFWAARTLHASGRLSLADWRASLAGRKIDGLLTGDDPWPAIRHLLPIAGRLLLRILRRPFTPSAAAHRPQPLSPDAP